MSNWKFSITLTITAILVLLGGLCFFAYSEPPEGKGKQISYEPLVVWDGSGLPLGYFVERENDCYVVYNPDLQGLLQVYLGEQPVAVPYYIPGYRFYFASDDSDCSGQAYVIFHDGYHHMQDIMKDLNWVNNQAAYKVDFTQQPLSATNMGYSIYGLPDTGVCEPYDVDSTAFPIVPIDFPTTLLNLQYPIEVKPMQ